MTDERLTRLLLMLPYVQAHPGVRLEDLARYLRCDRETLLADLDAALLCGVPPYLPNDYVSVTVEGGRLFVSFAEQFRRPLNLTCSEALALSLALRRAPLSRRGLETAARLNEKIAAVLPAGERDRWQKARRQVDLHPLNRELRARMAILQQAIEEGRQVRMEYYTAGRDAMTRRDVHPYALVEHNGEWYLVGHSPERNRETLFRIDRIRRLKLLDERFTVRRGFSVRAYRRSRMFHSGPVDQRVELWAAPELARWLRDERPLGRTRRAPDGSLRLSLRVGDPQWVFAWVMSHAGQLRVVGPELMRKRFVETCRKAAAVYR